MFKKSLYIFISSVCLSFNTAYAMEKEELNKKYERPMGPKTQEQVTKEEEDKNAHIADFYIKIYEAAGIDPKYLQLPKKYLSNNIGKK
jgi:hypothetical protein